MSSSTVQASPVSVRFLASLDRWIREQAVLEHRSVADMVRVLVEEARVNRLFPQIVYRNGPTGRRAAFLDGPDIWEVLEPYLLNGRDMDIFRESWQHLPAWKLDTALRFYDLFPEEIEVRVTRNNAE